MKQLFLTSTVDVVAFDIAKKIDVKNNNKLVFITTPADPKGGPHTDWMDDDRKALINVGFDVTDYTIVGKTKEQLEHDLKEYACIYVSGGDTAYMLKQSQKSGFIQVIQDLVNNQGKIYIGTSAGSIIAGSKCPDYLLSKQDMLDLENKDGYGLVNFTILPHWGSESFRKKYLDTRLSIAYKEDQVPLLLLTDTQYVHVINDTFKIIDVK